MNNPVETLLPNPALKPEDLDQMDQSFLDAARLADQGRDIPQSLVTGEKPGTPDNPDPKPTEPAPPTGDDEKGTDPATPERARDKLTGQFIKTPQEVADEKAQSEAVDASRTSSESEYTAKQRERKEKETARLDKTWENVNARKEELERRETELRQREQQMRQPVQPQRQRMMTDDGEVITSKMLSNAARDFGVEEQKARIAARKALEIGDYDEFGRQNDEADKQAGLARESSASADQFFQLEQKEAQQAAEQKHKAVWESHIVEAFKAEPDLTKPDSALAKGMQALLAEQGNILWMIPDGFKKGLEIVKLRLEAGSASELREANKNLKAEVDRLTSATAISGSGPASSATSQKKALTSEQEDAWLLAQAQKADGY